MERGEKIKHIYKGVERSVTASCWLAVTFHDGQPPLPPRDTHSPPLLSVPCVNR